MISATRSTYCTTREAAQLLGVSLRTAQLWSESGLLEAWKTEGGHRRISRASVHRLIEGGVSEHGGATSSPAVGRIRVLVVEDDSVLLKLYKTVIASWSLPVEVITASSGIEGLIRVGKDAPDIMICDLVMTGMDGFQLIRSLATSSFREGMEIVAVTGLDSADIQERGGLPSDIRIFPKPVPFPELKNILGSLIERRAGYL